MRCHTPWARNWRKAGRCIWTASAFFRPNLVSTEPVTEKTKRKNTKVRLKGIVYRPDRLLMDEVGKVKVQRTRFSFHSSKLTDEEIDALLTEFFTTHDFVQRKSFQLLCSMTQSTASRHLHRLCEEGKLKKCGTSQTTGL